MTKLDLNEVCRNGKPRTPDLLSRRAINPETGNPMPHAESRHIHRDEQLKDTEGNLFGQGKGQFPPHVKPGDITGMEKQLLFELHKYQGGHDSKIINTQQAGDAVRVKMSLHKFGVKIIGGFVFQNQVCTVFPEDEELLHR